jgi:hypothetical protein
LGGEGDGDVGAYRAGGSDDDGVFACEAEGHCLWWLMLRRGDVVCVK